MTHRSRRIVINSLIRAQTDLVRARTYATQEADQLGQELSVDLTEVVRAIDEIIDTVRKEDLA